LQNKGVSERYAQKSAVFFINIQTLWPKWCSCGQLNMRTFAAGRFLNLPQYRLDTMATIRFLFEDQSIPAKTITGNFVDQSILELTEDYDVHLNHNCGGVCACSTCHVYIEAGEDFLEEISDKEENFIDRAIRPRIESRLGCQCIILDEDADITVTVPDQRQIIGHEH
jgi:ferredoxin, 2Fe-2S